MKNLNENLKDSSIQSLELKANLNPEQRAYLEVLKDKMKKILGNKTKQELAKAGDLESLKNYKAILIEILEFLKTKNIKVPKPEANSEKIKVKDAIMVTVDNFTYSHNILPSYPGYVIYSKKKHDLSDIEIKHVNRAGTRLPGDRYIIVKE